MEIELDQLVIAEDLEYLCIRDRILTIRVRDKTNALVLLNYKLTTFFFQVRYFIDFTRILVIPFKGNWRRKEIGEEDAAISAIETLAKISMIQPNPEE